LVLEFPPSESLSRYVSLVSRYGTNFTPGRSQFLTSALITLPIADRDLLIDEDSLRRSPYAPVSFYRSLPARSIRWNFEVLMVATPSGVHSVRSIKMVQTLWEREERSFIEVEPICRFRVPIYSQ
jgi:hypothetical protein